MCAHVSADEQFREFGVISSNPDFPLICLKAIPLRLWDKTQIVKHLLFGSCTKLTNYVKPGIKPAIKV